MKHKIILISLYVDDKRPLEMDDVIDSRLIPDKTLKYAGQKWSELQTRKYQTNTQPLYVLMDHDENNLTVPVAITPNPVNYYKWLLEGLYNF